MSNDTSRIVKYVLTTELDPNAKANADKLVDLIKATQNEATKVSHEQDAARATVAQQTITDIEKSRTTAIGELRSANLKLTEFLKLQEESRTRAVEEEERRRQEARRKSESQWREDLKQHQETMRRSAYELNDGLLKAGEGVVTLTRGLAEIGILSEENSEKMLRNLIAIQATVDLTKGGIEVYRGIAAAVEAYRVKVMASVAAEELLAASRAKSAAAGMGGVGVPLPSVGGLAAAGGLGLAGAGALATVGVGAAGLMATNLGGARDWAASAISPDWVAPGTLFDSITAPYFDTVESGLQGVGLGGEDSSGVISPWIAARRKAFASKDAADQMSGRLQLQREMFERGNDVANKSFAEESRMRDLRMGSILSRRGLTSDDVLEELTKAQDRMRGARQQTAQVEARASSPMQRAEMERAMQREESITKNIVTLREKAASLSQQEATNRLTAIREETTGIREQIALRDKERMAAESRLDSSVQRFADMPEAEQRRLISASEKAKSGGILSRDERSSLRTIGTQEAMEKARESAYTAAYQAGYGKLLGVNEELNAMQAANQEIAQLKRKLQMKTEVTIVIESDIGKIMAATQAYVNQALDNQYERWIEKMKSDLPITNYSITRGPNISVGS